MARSVQTAVLAAALLALAGCGDKEAGGLAQAPERTESAPPAQSTPPATPTTPPTPSTPTDPGAQPEDDPPTDREELLRLLVPEGVPTEADGQPADPADLAVVKRWLKALQQGDIAAAADTFADGTRVQNLRPLMRLRNRAARRAFNAGFPCGAEIVDASSVRGYLVVTYRLTDRVDSPCDGPGGTAAGTIKVEGGRMTEWYRLPDPPQEPGEPGGPVV